MALQAEAKRIAAEFEYSDAEVNKGVAEFIAQMSTSHQKDPPVELGFDNWYR